MSTGGMTNPRNACCLYAFICICLFHLSRPFSFDKLLFSYNSDAIRVFEGSGFLILFSFLLFCTRRWWPHRCFAFTQLVEITSRHGVNIRHLTLIISTFSECFVHMYSVAVVLFVVTPSSMNIIVCRVMCTRQKALCFYRLERYVFRRMF